MADDRGVIRSISWRDLFPWLLLARVFRLSISIQLLFFATLGVVLQPVGWRVSEALLLKEEDRQEGPRDPRALSNPDRAFISVVRTNRSWPGELDRIPRAALPLQLADILAPFDGITHAFHRLSLPVRYMFHPALKVRQFAYLVIGNLWTLAVWSFCGAVIARVAVVNLAREERVSTKRAVMHAVRKFPAYFAAPLAMLVLVFLSAIVPALLGLLLRVDLFAPVVGVVWIVGLLFGLIMTICLLALVFGWPLMWGTVAAENSDYLDALSRSFAYTLQKPLAYLFYAAVAALLGGLGWIVVYWFAEVVIWLTLWGASWGTGHDRFQEILQQAPIASGVPLPLRDPAFRSPVDPPPEPAEAVVLGVRMINFWHALVRSIAVAYLFSFFWSAAAGIYLLLRRDVDQKEIDEVFLEDEDEASMLPPLPTDAAGVPGAPTSEPPAPEPSPPSDTTGASQGSAPE